MIKLRHTNIRMSRHVSPETPREKQPLVERGFQARAGIAETTKDSSLADFIVTLLL